MNRLKRLLISPRAELDLLEIAEYIARDNPTRAVSFIDALEAKCRGLVDDARLHPPRDDVAPGLRIAVHRRHLILFRIIEDQETVRVERIVHGARDLRRLR